MLFKRPLMLWWSYAKKVSLSRVVDIEAKKVKFFWIFLCSVTRKPSFLVLLLLVLCIVDESKHWVAEVQASSQQRQVSHDKTDLKSGGKVSWWSHRVENRHSPFVLMRRLWNHEVPGIRASSAVLFQQHPTTKALPRRSWWCRIARAYASWFRTDTWRAERKCRSSNRRKHRMLWFPRPETSLRSSSMFRRYPGSHRRSRICRESARWCSAPVMKVELVTTATITQHDAHILRNSLSAAQPHLVGSDVENCAKLRHFPAFPTKWGSQVVKRTVKSTHQLKNFDEDCCNCFDWRHDCRFVFLPF